MEVYRWKRWKKNTPFGVPKNGQRVSIVFYVGCLSDCNGYKIEMAGEDPSFAENNIQGGKLTYGQQQAFVLMYAMILSYQAIIITRTVFTEN